MRQERSSSQRRAMALAQPKQLVMLFERKYDAANDAKNDLVRQMELALCALDDLREELRETTREGDYLSLVFAQRRQVTDTDRLRVFSVVKDALPGARRRSTSELREWRERSAQIENNCLEVAARVLEAVATGAPSDPVAVISQLVRLHQMLAICCPILAGAGTIEQPTNEAVRATKSILTLLGGANAKTSTFNRMIDANAFAGAESVPGASVPKLISTSATQADGTVHFDHMVAERLDELTHIVQGNKKRMVQSATHRGKRAPASSASVLQKSFFLTQQLMAIVAIRLSQFAGLQSVKLRAALDAALEWQSSGAEKLNFANAKSLAKLASGTVFSQLETVSGQYTEMDMLAGTRGQMQGIIKTFFRERDDVDKQLAALDEPQPIKNATLLTSATYSSLARIVALYSQNRGAIASTAGPLTARVNESYL